MLLDTSLAPGEACNAPSGEHTRMGQGPAEDEEGLFPMQTVLRWRGDLIYKHTSEWNVNVQSKEEVQAKVEELFVFATLLYGVAGLQVKTSRPISSCERTPYSRRSCA